MGQKDIAEKILEDYNDVFADIHSQDITCCWENAQGWDRNVAHVYL